MGSIIDGKSIAAQIRASIKIDAEAFVLRARRKPGLAAVLVGDNPASEVYVKNKIAACAEAGIASFSHVLKGDISERDLLIEINKLNGDDSVDGILVQLPLPNHSERAVLEAIANTKDVDGFSFEQSGRLMLGADCLAPCTPSGCIELIKSTGEAIAGKHAVVVGRSNIVGKPLSLMLLKENATVTVCHSKTKDLSAITSKADILIAAIGQKEFIKADMVKAGAIVIDVGINRFEGRLYGDVDFDKVKAKAAYITPVPGGVGPMTIAMLMQNTLKAANKNA